MAPVYSGAANGGLEQKVVCASENLEEFNCLCSRATEKSQCQETEKEDDCEIEGSQRAK